MKSPKRKPTIYDIATASSASPTAVSLVLNGQWKKHRIKPETASLILRCAGEMGYSVNQKARALRLARSGLAGMIIPHYRNRFFAGLAECFESEVRERDQCPIVVSTQRDPKIEKRVAEALLAQQVEFLFIAGVHDPSPINDLCAAAGIRCVNVDLPGPKAPSVISDNRGSAAQVTELIIRKLEASGLPIDDWFFFGGVRDDNSTRERIKGFTSALAGHGIVLEEAAFRCEGYAPSIAENALAQRYHREGRLPAGLFVNGITGLEGAATFLASLPRETWNSTRIAAFDWDPFAVQMPYEITFVRQDVEAMISAGFALIDEYPDGENPVIVVPANVR
ncbi:MULTISPECIES: substrate-binding domain-containing protein [Agrobacterium]|uniref:Substrate-binding domain-containing protein n=1 Tax=Agrobacterium rubi TaxID=28099 RepID=A0AAE7US42_9HYPH|nr:MULTISPECIES: substrate-binding domain-containing protein [Agrobacterium]MBN7808894.1 substrate-binding domain-containing protein [Agrobacterium rosae]NTE90184.1 substrate-binding domain-containing protein [Agrobacterium rubi]NTF06003.1 substrate-binding domain-containing protein [Agrobacterium rubi]NTF40242.1 substrate-binding domain-containing protein [Agrobacterium rubi]OCJ53033.1 LacI family transcriptional regulator [Agrobacterium rubi]